MPWRAMFNFKSTKAVVLTPQRAKGAITPNKTEEKIFFLVVVLYMFYGKFTCKSARRRYPISSAGKPGGAEG